MEDLDFTPLFAWAYFKVINLHQWGQITNETFLVTLTSPYTIKGPFILQIYMFSEEVIGLSYFSWFPWNMYNNWTI